MWKLADGRAELLRREQQAHAYAARRVAGPAPPRSWRPRERKAPEEPAVAPDREASEAELATAEAFLGHPQRTGAGAPSLVDVCLRLTLQLLRDDTVVWDEEGEGPVTMRDAVSAGVTELDLHLRGALLSASARLPPGNPLRLADGDIRLLLEDEALASPPSEEGEDEWDTGATRPTLHHLPLMAHPAPLRLLRDVPRLAALTLTSLDLGFAALPPLERLVPALPAGLRALGLAGVRAAKSDWERGLGALARKMIVLQVSSRGSWWSRIPRSHRIHVDGRRSTCPTFPSVLARRSRRSSPPALVVLSTSPPCGSWDCAAMISGTTRTTLPLGVRCCEPP